MTSDQTCVIVGASLAGAKAAETLRAEGFDEDRQLADPGDATLRAFADHGGATSVFGDTAIAAAADCIEAKLARTGART